MNFIQNTIFSLLGVSAIAVQAATFSLDESTANSGYFTYKSGNTDIAWIGEFSQFGYEGLYIAGGPNMALYLNTAEISSGADLDKKRLTIRNIDDLFLKSRDGGIDVESAQDITFTALKPESRPNDPVGNIVLNSTKHIINADTEVNGSLAVNGNEVITKSISGTTAIAKGLEIGGSNTFNQAFNSGGFAVGGANTINGTAFALGSSNTIQATRGAAVIGRDNNVKGDGSLIAGSANIVGNVNDFQASYVFGVGNKVPNGGNFVYGTSNELGESTYVSSVHGTFNKITSANSGVMVNGWSNNISSVGSFTAGYYLENNSHSMIALGYWNKPSANADANNLVDDDHLFVIGNGTSETTRSNAFVVLKNGDIIIPKVQGDVAMGIFGD